MTACQVYTVGNGKRHQYAMREDGMWFARSRKFDLRDGWVWGEWKPHGRSKPYEFGMYLAPRMGLARLPPVKEG